MHGRGIWRLAQAMLLVVAIAFAAANVGPIIAGGDVPVALAGNDKDKDKDKKDKKNVGSDDDQDHKIDAQVLEINTLKDPPELVVGTMDGETVVRVLKTDEIALNGVRLGDYIQITGEKVSEKLWDANELSVSEHFTAEAKNDKKNDNKKK